MIWLRPTIAVRRLLKSCARPPASCRTASIFCVWRRFSSASRLAVTSRTTSASEIVASALSFDVDASNVNELPSCRSACSSSSPGSIVVASPLTRKSASAERNLPRSDDEIGERAPNRGFAAHAEQAFGRRVHVQHAQLPVGRQDRVSHRGDQRREPCL